MGYKRLIYIFIFIIGLLAIGTIGYVTIDDYPISDALYMTVITVSTVGFGETYPLSQAGRLFTSVLIFVGFAGVAVTGQILVRGVFEGVWSGELETRKMKARLNKLKDHYIVCGYGRVGTSAAQSLADAGADFVIVDNGKELPPDIVEKNFIHFKGDATDEATLLEVGIKRAKGLMALLNSDPDNLFLTLTARELNPVLYIVSRANDTTAEHKIMRAGADKVITPTVSAAQQLVRAVLGGTGVSIDDTITTEAAAVPKWISVSENSGMVGLTISALSKMMSRPILGLRRTGIDFILPDAAVTIIPNDQIFVIYDSSKDSEKLDAHAGQTVVIIDDNPVILQLYARLFRRKGFAPVLATNGREGLDAIIREKPMVAVVDFMLPVMSGIDLCKQVRTRSELDNTKLLLFTADDQEETRRRALKAGADDVIVKSANASKIINSVIAVLKTMPQSSEPQTASMDDFLTPPPESAPLEVLEHISEEELETKVTEELLTSAIAPETPQLSPTLANDSINLDAAFEMVGGEKEMVMELFKSCQMEMPDVLQEISEAIKLEDGDKLRASAHKIKGTFIYVAAAAAADLARQLEELGRDGNLVAVPSISDLFFNECECVDEFITQYLTVNGNNIA